MCGAGETVEQIPDAHGMRVGQVEALAVFAFQVCDVVHRRDDKVDRDDIDASAFDADRRHPARQRLAHLLDQLEEIVGAVDLVRLAGARIADDDAGPEDSPRNLALFAHDAFRIVLRTEVRVVQVLCLLEHVFAEEALEQTGGGDRADQVEVLDGESLGKADRIPGSVDVGALLHFSAGVQIVDCGEMEEMGDLPLEFPDVGFRDAEVRLRQVADDRYDPFFIDAPVLAESFHERNLDRANEDIDGALGAQKQFGDETFSDKAGSASDEIVHSCLPEKVLFRRPI